MLRSALALVFMYALVLLLGGMCCCCSGFVLYVQRLIAESISYSTLLQTA